MQILQTPRRPSNDPSQLEATPDYVLRQMEARQWLALQRLLTHLIGLVESLPAGHDPVMALLQEKQRLIELSKPAFDRAAPLHDLIAAEHQCEVSTGNLSFRVSA